jgi:hypothetical protein
MSTGRARVFLVSHFHWDREWYRPFEAYRGRLVDAVDRVLDLVDADPGVRFVLDGQAILLEDYLAVRPERRHALVRGLVGGRLAAGPWYVQPDVLLPAGESLVRNLLRGRAVTTAFGPVARTGYLPDSFGHPAELPTILVGFGIDRFVYWRGNGDEVAETGARWRWIAPDGSAVTAVLLPEGYFNAACLPADVDQAARGLATTVARLRETYGDPVILMNGFDHMLPDAHTDVVAAGLAALLGEPVERALLDDAVDHIAGELPEFAGELLGGRLANLLPGVWSTRMSLKLANRRCETLLRGWLEPWAALARALGQGDERPALENAWRTLLENHAHDTICGCSLDAVAARAQARFADVHGLGEATLARLLDRLAGQGAERRTPWTLGIDVLVFNPSAHPRTDVVRVPLDPYPAMRIPLGIPEFPPLGLAASAPPGFTAGGRPVRVLPTDDPTRPRWLPEQTPFDVELVVADVPAFGIRRIRLEPGPPVDDQVDGEREIAVDGLCVRTNDDGTLDVTLGGVTHRGLLGVEDDGDRGDSYDCDPIPGEVATTSVAWTRRRHPSGIATLAVRRVLEVPRRLSDDRLTRVGACGSVVLTTEARLVPGVLRVDVRIRLENGATDHRLRVCFPTGRPAAQACAAGAFGAATRATVPRRAAGWVHPPPSTFPHQGWVAANGLMVVAPGLPEAEVRADGTILVTLVRAVGWLARYDVRTRPVPAGPAMAIPGAQEPGPLEARLALCAGADPVVAWDAELGLRGTIGGGRSVLAEGEPLLALEPPTLLVSAVKPAEEGRGMVVRVLNPGPRAERAILRVGFPVGGVQPVRLDETPVDEPVERRDERTIGFAVPARALRSLCLVPASVGGT